MEVLPAGYWAQSHPHPLAPNLEDVETFRNLIGRSESVLLLGNTPALMDLCTTAMDLEPFVNDPKVVQQDWVTNTNYYDAIIGDGVLNFTESLASGLIEMASEYSSLFVVRSFTRRLPIMRVADNFPGPRDFSKTPTKIIERDDYRFFVWNFATSVIHSKTEQ